MKLKLILAIVMSLVFMLSACGPAGNVPKTEPPIVDPPPTVTEPQVTQEQPPVATESPEASPEESTPTEVVPPPAPASRGPDLEATDPSTVALASGNLQLVEFFRFT